MSKIRYSPSARADILAIMEYISSDLDSPQAARKTVNRIRRNILTLERFPRSGAPLDDYVSVKTDYRKLVCGNYLAFYRVEPGYVNIVRVLYGGRNWAKILFGDMAEWTENTDILKD